VYLERELSRNFSGAWPDKQLKTIRKFL
jgi:hypothetical protein